MKVLTFRQGFLQGSQFSCQVLLGGKHGTYLHEGSYHEDAHLDCLLAMQYVGRHDPAMLRKGPEEFAQATVAGT